MISNDDTSNRKPIRGPRRRFIFAKRFLTRTSQEIILLLCTRTQRSTRYCVTVSHNNIMPHTYISAIGYIIGARICYYIYVRVAISLIDILNLLRNNHQSLVLKSYTHDVYIAPIYYYLLYIKYTRVFYTLISFKRSVFIFTKTISRHSYVVN